jgi:hypothetical protein
MNDFTPFVLVWNRVLKKGFILNKSYDLIFHDIQDISAITYTSVVEDYGYFPGFHHQLPDWVFFNHILPNTNLVFPLNKHEWVSYFFT